MSLAPHEVHHRLNTDLPFFAEHAPLYIKGKTVEGAGEGPVSSQEGGLVRFRLNRAQRHIHDQIEKQKRERGWVRALLLKGRQQGGSTYVAARYYHAARSIPGTSVFIISHEGKSTNKLFRMVERFQENVNPVLRPVVTIANTNQLIFGEINSDYGVGTAGNKDVGRGGTAQRIHGSEVAYWENDYEIQEGALESIALAAGTEVILESTANGPKGLFYDKCSLALKGEGDYILIFVPWYWQDEYERDVTASFVPTEEEEKFIAHHLSKPFPGESETISRAQAYRKLAWRRSKIVELSTGNNPASGQAKFRQTYPSTPVEAFLFTGIGLFRPDAVMDARKSTITDDEAPLIAGVDPAGDTEGSDRTVIVLRRGRVIEDVIVHAKMTPMKLAGICGNLIVDRGVDMMFIDRGYGEGTIDRLHELKYGRFVQGVAFNEGTLYPTQYVNKRSEIIIEFANWVNAGGVRIPDSDTFNADLAVVPLDQETSNNLKFILSKKELKKLLGGRSTDILDAAALTFAYPVKRDLREASGARQSGGIVKATNSGRGPLSSMSRLRGGR